MYVVDRVDLGVTGQNIMMWFPYVPSPSIIHLPGTGHGGIQSILFTFYLLEHLLDPLRLHKSTGSI
jgi:hypothetical protein